MQWIRMLLKFKNIRACDIPKYIDKTCTKIIVVCLFFYSIIQMIQDTTWSWIRLMTQNAHDERYFMFKCKIYRLKVKVWKWSIYREGNRVNHEETWQQQKPYPKMHFAENKHVIKGQHYKHAQEYAERIILSSIFNYTRHVFINVKC